MRFTHIFVAVPGGSVEVLNGTDAAAFDALQALPNVALVEYDRIGHVAVSSQREVRAALPVNRSAVVGGNGVLELQAGQTVTALYQQPDGSVLTTTLHM